MFSNLTPNSILYVLDMKGPNRILTGPIERVSVPRPKYNTFNPSMEMVVDMVANIGGERREFKGIPNNSVADFGDDTFVLADSRESLNSYISAMLQNSRNIVNSYELHKKRMEIYEEASQELNPGVKASRENDRAIQSLKDQVQALQESMQKMLGMMQGNAKTE